MSLRVLLEIELGIGGNIYSIYKELYVGFERSVGLPQLRETVVRKLVP
jgi:hypothetical protein